MKFDLSLFSRYRAELMGVATVLIIICHMPAHGVVMPTPIASILVYGGLGCDIFLFLSGMGMWYSLSKNTLSGQLGGAFTWILKRYLRVIVPYLLITIPCFAVDSYLDVWTIGQYFWRLSTLSFWTEGWGLWFVSLILVLYLLTPLLYRILNGKYKWWILCVLILLAWAYGSVPALVGFLKNVQFVVCRIPCYLIGFAAAEEIKAKRKVNIFLFILPLLALFALSLLLRFVVELSVSLFWIEGLLLLVFLSLMIEAIKKCNWMMISLTFMGGISLESYVTNVFTLPFFKLIPWQYGRVNLNPGNWTYYVFGTICCIILSVIVNKVSKRLIKRFSDKNYV